MEQTAMRQKKLSFFRSKDARRPSQCHSKKPPSLKQNCACYNEDSDSPVRGKARAEYHQFRWNGKILDGYCETGNRLLRFHASISCKVVDRARGDAWIDTNFA